MSAIAIVTAVTTSDGNGWNIRTADTHAGGNAALFRSAFLRHAPTVRAPTIRNPEGEDGDCRLAIVGTCHSGIEIWNWRLSIDD